MEFGAILVARGLLSPHQLEMAREAEADGKRLDHAVVEMGFVREEDALRALAEALQLRYAELGDHQVDATLLQGFPSKLIYRKNVFPLERTNGVLQVATSDPFDIYVLDELGTLTGLDIEPVLVTREDIARLIKQHLGVGGETVDQLVAQRGDIELLDETDGDTSELAEMAQEASVIRLVNEFLVEAIDLRASDVHLEPQEHGLRIRYRIDGVLHSQPVPAEINRFHSAILSRLKIMARLNIAEKRLPQDGRIRLRVAGRDVDIRVSVIPMLHGEGIVMRLLDKGRMVFNLRGIGMAEDSYATFQELIKRPHGILLVTGPTGSGKTTTLYSALNEIKSDFTKIITIEDPVEYHIDGINQIQVHSRIGLTFASGLRSILRHDPDIILVGEIRDLETAEIAIQSSLTGHLVFSTLHTNDAAGAFTRLTDMGVEPFLVASTVEAVMAQRLVRTICSECKTAYRPDELPADFPDLGDTPLYRGAGCRACRDTGYLGRTGIFELLTTSEEVQRLTVEHVSSGAVRAQARKEGMVSLRQDGWRNVLAGVTTIDEVLRVSKGDVVAGA
jgi:general secretion pathway protein E